MNESDNLTINFLSDSVDDNNDIGYVNGKEISLESEPATSNDELERKHFQRILNAFRSYKVHGLQKLHSSLRYVSSLPSQQQDLLEGYRAHLHRVQGAIEHNHKIIEVIVKDVAHLFQNTDHTEDTVSSLSKVHGSEVRASDMEKVQSVLKQLFREWSSEGREEREASFRPILDEISLRFPRTQLGPESVQVLVPGAGLGRLPFEIAKMGYSCQGNEFSLFMLFASNFVLNKCQDVDLYKIYPWTHQHYNNLKSVDQVQEVHFPDINPSQLPLNVQDFSMAAGSFLEIYKEPDAWDCITTCFFIDTANNIIDYIETTWNILKPGGYWINLGPLLYHYADSPKENSIEPSYEQIRSIIGEFGFNMLKEELNIPTPYAQNPKSMMSYEYRSVFFVCQKPKSS